MLLLLDYVVEYFKRNKLVLRLVERNFSWPMVAKQMSERRGPLWARLMRDLEASPLAARYTEDELFKMIFVIIEMLGSVCYSSIIEGKPGTVDNMKPVLYGIVRKILSWRAAGSLNSNTAVLYTPETYFSVPNRSDNR